MINVFMGYHGIDKRSRIRFCVPSARTTIPSTRLSVCPARRLCVCGGAYGVGHSLESGRSKLEKYIYIYIYNKSLPWKLNRILNMGKRLKTRWVCCILKNM